MFPNPPSGTHTQSTFFTPSRLLVRQKRGLPPGPQRPDWETLQWVVKRRPRAETGGVSQPPASARSPSRVAACRPALTPTVFTRSDEEEAV